jgi:parallel beta-helix repeat protein
MDFSRLAIHALIAPVLIVSAPRVASAETYFVATFGSDNGPGTEARPFGTIRRGIEEAQTGDTVYIRGGTYTDWDNQLNPTRSGTSGAWITFAAYPGELPILDGASLEDGSGVEPIDNAVSYIRVQGLVAINWPTSGFSNGWDNPSGNMEFRYCIADNNGINGISFYKSQGVLIEHCIAAHNGNQEPSWSSGVNIFQVSGSYQTNIVRGNVSFENIDICGRSSHACDPNQSTDGNGFILDSSSTGALFENNIAFRNGGSGLRVSNSTGAHFVNNTCFHNTQDSGYEFTQTEVYFSDTTSQQNVVMVNNLIAASRGAFSWTTGSDIVLRELLGRVGLPPGRGLELGHRPGNQ